MPTIHELIERLPLELQREVRDFVEFLMTRRRSHPQRDLSFRWRGALRDLRDQYSSVELEHKSQQWWGD